MPPLVSGSGYAVWKPKAEVFLGLKGLKEALLDFTTEKQWLKVTKRAAEWAAAEKQELLQALFGDDNDDVEHHDEQSSVSGSSAQSTSLEADAAAARASKSPTSGHAVPSKEKEAEMRKQAIAMIKRSEMAYGHLFGALPSDVALMVRVLPQGWAHGLWMWLERKFSSTEADNVNALLRDWHALRQADGEPYDLYRARVDELYVRLAAAKEKPTPRAYAYALVNSLLPQYEPVVMALETGMLLSVKDYEEIKWVDVAKIINMHERKLLAQASKLAETAAHAKAMSLQQRFRRKGQTDGAAAGGSAAGSNGGSAHADKRLCWKCGQPGHVKASCPESKSASTKPASPSAKGGQSAAGLQGAHKGPTTTRDQQDQSQMLASLCAAHAPADRSDGLAQSGNVEFDAAHLRASHGAMAAMKQSAGPVMAVSSAKTSGTVEKEIGVDTMASIHVSADVDLFLSMRSCKPFLVRGMDGGEIEASLCGEVQLQLTDRSSGKQFAVTLQNVYYHPKFAASLLSVDCLVRLGWCFHSDEHGSFLLTPGHQTVILHQDQHVSLLRCTSGATGSRPVESVYNTSSAGTSTATAVDALVRLHEQLGHVGFDRMVVMLEKQVTDGMARKPVSSEVLAKARTQVLQCKACVQGKGTRVAFGHRGLDKGTRPGEVLHMDTNHVTVVDEQGRKVKSYGVNMIDPFSGARFKQHLSNKDLIAGVVIETIKLVQRQSDWKLKRLFTDGGTEFVNGALKAFIASEGMLMHNSPPRTQELDGVAERVVRTGKDMERTMLLHAGLDAATYFRYACCHAVFVWNRTYISSNTGVTPFEAMYKRKPSMMHWGVFGCDCFYHVAKKDRRTYDAKMLPGIYLGHDLTHNCATVQDLATGKVIFTRDVRFRNARFTHAAALRAGDMRVRQLIDAGYSDDESAAPGADVEPLELDEDEQEWEVERIVGKRIVDGHVQYRVHWSSFSQAHDSWEPLENLDNAAVLIDEFERDQSSSSVQSVSGDRRDDVHAAAALPEQPAVDPPASVDSAAAAVDSADSENQLHPPADKTDELQMRSEVKDNQTEAAHEAGAPEPSTAVMQHDVGQRRSARDHASSRAHDRGASQVNFNGKHVHMAMSALCGMLPGGDMTFTEPQMVHAVSTALAQLQDDTPATWKQAMASPEASKWKAAADKEMTSIDEMGVWDLVPRVSIPRGQIVIPCKWVFKIKTDEHGAVTVYKARLTPKGFMQREGINVYETFAATGKYKSMRLGLSIAAACDYELDQMDVPVAFQQAELDEEVYMELPEGYRQGREHLVCKLRKALYGLKQGPRNWWLLISQFLRDIGFKATVSDPCLFFMRSKSGRLLLLFLFVDDMQVSYHAADADEWSQLKAQLVQRFNTKDMGPSTWILGMRIKRNRKTRTITLDQELYVTKALQRYGMQECKVASTPEVVGSVSGCSEKELSAPADVQLFQEIVGTLMYAAVSCRLDIAHAVHALASDMQAPTGRSMLAAKRVLRYLAGTKDIGLVFGASASGNADVSDTRGRSNSLVEVCAYADADWANDKKDRKSITGWVAKLNGDPISWSSKKQRVVALSTCEAELYAEGAAVQEVLWLRDLLTELGLHVQFGSLVYGDNQSTLAVSQNGVKSDRTKHVDVKYHFITQTVEQGAVKLKWIPTAEQQADIFTKALAVPVFERLRQQLMSR
jgi:hypothetical protein